jgi:hypothetical protein
MHDDTPAGHHPQLPILSQLCDEAGVLLRLKGITRGLSAASSGAPVPRMSPSDQSPDGREGQKNTQPYQDQT